MISDSWPRRGSTSRPVGQVSLPEVDEMMSRWRHSEKVNHCAMLCPMCLEFVRTMMMFKHAYKAAGNGAERDLYIELLMATI